MTPTFYERIEQITDETETNLIRLLNTDNLPPRMTLQDAAILGNRIMLSRRHLHETAKIARQIADATR